VADNPCHNTHPGAINGTNLVVDLVSPGKNTYQFDAAGSPVAFVGITNPKTVFSHYRQ
jgi:hypothetical protein